MPRLRAQAGKSCNGSEMVKACPVATFSSKGDGVCADCHRWCLAGTELTSCGGSAAGVCKPCPAGFFKASNGFGKCIAHMSTSRRLAKKQAAVVSLCAAGKYAIAGTTVSDVVCDVCPRGFSCADGTKTACPKGTSSDRNQVACTSCDVSVGEWQDEEGQGVCRTCAAGTYHDLLKEVGSYEYTTKADAKAACVAGGFAGLCTTAEVGQVRSNEPAACFAGWTSDAAVPGFFNLQGQAGCDANSDANSWVNYSANGQNAGAFWLASKAFAMSQQSCDM